MLPRFEAAGQRQHLLRPLQQLGTILYSEMIYVSSMTIEPAVANIILCERTWWSFQRKVVTTTGLVLPSQNARAAAAKSPRDVRKLSQVADAFPKDRIHPYIIFSKIAPFAAEEIARCRGRAAGGAVAHDPAFGPRTRTVFVYEWAAAKEFEIDATAISLEDLAKTTHGLYFQSETESCPLGVYPLESWGMCVYISAVETATWHT